VPISHLIADISVASLVFVVYLIVALGVALVVHEFAHAAVAVRLGDHTPRQAGRLTLNPRPHVDPFGTLILPAILLLPRLFGAALFPIFAYAKPQPLNPWNLRNQTTHGVFIAAAGPVANVVLAFVYGGLIRLAGTGELGRFLFAGLLVNVTMAAMHLIPFPPLDASRVLARVLSGRAQEVYMSWEPFGALFILVIFFIVPGPIFAFVRVVGRGICELAAGAACV
jgi:Zn-dependent protease